MNVAGLVALLPVLGKGMLGVFAVITVIWLCIVLLKKVCK